VRGDAAFQDAARKLTDKMNAVLAELYQPEYTGFDDQMLVYPMKLNNRIAAPWRCRRKAYDTIHTSC
jgi:hypothetical protein